MAKKIIGRIKQITKTSTEWVVNDPILLEGEIGYASDTKEFKIGDGSSKWTALTSYARVSDIPAVVNELTSNSTTDALSANQGKVLNDKFSNYVPTSRKVNNQVLSSDITLYTGTLTEGNVLLADTNGNYRDSGFTLGKSVPADAEFTDTKYSLPEATSNTLGGVKVGNNISVNSGTISITDSNIASALGYTPISPTSLGNVKSELEAGIDEVSDRLDEFTVESGLSNFGVNSAIPENYYFIKIVEGNGVYVGIVSNSVNYINEPAANIYYSYDLQSWSLVEDVLTSDLSYGNGVFLAGGGRYYSSDGINWIDNNSKAPGSDSRYAIVFNGSRFIALPSYSSLDTWYSNDGINWQEGEDLDSNSPAIYMSEFWNGRYIGVDNYGYWYSDNLTTWNSCNTPINMEAGDALPLQFILSEDKIFSNVIYIDFNTGIAHYKTIVSEDGINWSFVQNLPSNINGFAPVGKSYVTWTDDGSVYYSFDMSTWELSSIKVDALSLQFTDTLPLSTGYSVGKLLFIEKYILEQSNGGIKLSAVDGLQEELTEITQDVETQLNQKVGIIAPTAVDNIFVAAATSGTFILKDSGVSITSITNALNGYVLKVGEGIATMDDINAIITEANAAYTASALETSLDELKEIESYNVEDEDNA